MRVEEGRGGMDEGLWKRSDGGKIGLIYRIYTKTPHIDMTQMNKNTIIILLHDDCGWILTQSLPQQSI